MNVDVNLLYGIQNLLQFLNDNWGIIVSILGLAFALSKKIQDFINKSNEEKIEIAKKQIQETMLKLITDAEISWQEYKKSGSIKRSQVIEQIFDKYPILSKATNQEEIVTFIDKMIDDALETMRVVFEENKNN